MKDRATQLLIKYKSGALVTQFLIDIQKSCAVYVNNIFSSFLYSAKNSDSLMLVSGLRLSAETVVKLQRSRRPSQAGHTLPGWKQTLSANLLNTNNCSIFSFLWIDSPGVSLQRNGQQYKSCNSDTSHLVFLIDCKTVSLCSSCETVDSK